MVDSPARPNLLPLGAGIGLTAMSALLLQVALTRVFAVVMWHHFAFMIVSLALLGFGASGSLLTVWRIGERRDAGWARLASFASGFGIFVILAFFLAIRIRVDTIELLSQPINLFKLMLVYLVLSLPFLFCGFTIGTTLAWYPERVGMLYFFDLIGSALGGGLAPFLLERLHIDAVVMLSALLALAAGALFAAGAGWGRRVAHAALAAAGLALVVGFSGGGLGIPPLHCEIPFAPHKIFAKTFFQDGPSAATLPSAIAQVDISYPYRRPMMMAADFGALGSQVVTMRGVTQDGSAPTVMYEHASDVSRFPALADSQAATAFLAYAATGREQPEVLVIGVGGGVDVMMARFFRAKKVTAIEINQAMTNMVTRDYADFLGGLFSAPEVRLVREEGRSYLKRSQETYDIIQLSGTDTFTALSSGVYSLSEGYIYTTEALMEMYAHLKEGGYINYSRIMIYPGKRQRETLRLANVARAALERLGVADPSRNIAVFQGVYWASTIVRKGPFTEAEIRKLREFAERENFLGFVYDPLRPTAPVTDNGEVFYVRSLAPRLLPKEAEPGEDTLQQLEAALRFTLDGDDRQADAHTSLAAASLVGSPAVAARVADRLRAELKSTAATIRPLLDYRKKIAQHYRQVLHSSPAERERFVAEYPYDLRAPSDDKPFFFDYFKIGKLRAATSLESSFNEGSPDFPVGHAVLVASLVQLAGWATLLILLPLRWLPKADGPVPQKLWIFLYFGALGCGFMFVEISLMQRLVLFLGHPTYSLSVVLTSLLAFSGLGALCSSQVREVTRRTLLGVLAAVVLLLLLDGVGMGWALAQTIHFERPLRILIAVLLLAPTGFVLGFPFPLGIRWLKDSAPALIPWGWAINGFLSVAGALVAVMIAMAAGFSAVLLASAATYLVALAAVTAAPPPLRRG